jgi:predicted transcriptional regulator
MNVSKRLGDIEPEMQVELQEIGPDDELDEADLRGIADCEAGRTISNEAVVRWLQSIVEGNPLPRPQIGD